MRLADVERENGEGKQTEISAGESLESCWKHSSDRKIKEMEARNNTGRKRRKKINSSSCRKENNWPRNIKDGKKNEGKEKEAN